MLSKFLKFVVLYITMDISITLIYSRENLRYECILGSKTPYRCVANYDDSKLTYPGCTEKKIWLITRHGTRYPGKKYIPYMMNDLPQLQNKLLKNHESGKINLSSNTVELLKKWKPPIIQSDAMKLATEGENEMIDLAERYQERFPTLMSEIYSNQTYKFRFTSTQRTEESAKHFAIGLFGWHNSHNVWYPESLYQDPVLRFYKVCPRWRKEVDKNPDAKLEKTKFLDSKPVKDMIDNIRKRVGFDVNYETIHLMYTMCAFETAWNQSIVSPWCKLFSLNDFKIFEYAEDLEFYWIDGYGNPLTYEQACPALRDMFDFFDSEEGPLTTAYFTHSGTILKVLALLRVAKDIHPLTHESFDKEDKRAWKSSIIDTFASNIAFVLYNCTSQGPSILLMLQEQPIYLPNCPNNMPCPLVIMKAVYPDRKEECQFDAICRVTSNI